MVTSISITKDDNIFKTNPYLENMVAVGGGGGGGRFFFRLEKRPVGGRGGGGVGGRFAFLWIYYQSKYLEILRMVVPMVVLEF